MKERKIFPTLTKQILSVKLGIVSIWIDKSDEDVKQDSERPEYDDAPNMDVESEMFDKFLELYVEIPSLDGEVKIQRRVKGRKRDSDRKLIGKVHDNPLLNTAVYLVETPYGRLEEYSANVISENIYSQVDDDGYNFDLLYEIIDHKSDDTTMHKKDGYFHKKSGTKRRVITTRGWKLRVKWETEEHPWIALKDIKASNPVEVAEYAVR